MALRLKRGQELQIVIVPGAVSGFDVLTRGRVVVDGHAHERVTSKISVADEAAAWQAVSSMAQDKLVDIGMEAG